MQKSQIAYASVNPAQPNFSAALSANKDSTDAAQRQLAYYAYPQAGMYCVFSFGLAMMLSSFLATLGVNKRSIFWMRQSNRLASLICLIEFFAWVILLIFGIPSPTQKSFHIFYYDLWNSTQPPNPMLPHPKDLYYTLEKNLVSSAVFLFFLFIFHGSFVYYNGKVTSQWLEADYRANQDKKLAQLQPTSDAAAGASVRRRSQVEMQPVATFHVV